MAHRITLTGTPLKFRLYGEKVAFDFIEKGSSDAPKGLPVSRDIRYTCLMNDKQFAKLGVKPEDIKKHRYLIQGEPTLDLPARECPGEIGVIVFKIDFLTPKEKSNEPSLERKDTLLSLDEISIPKEFLEKSPNRTKTQITVEYVKRTGQVEKPITIDQKTHVLIDGYRQYYVAKMLGLKEVPVMYVTKIA